MEKTLTEELNEMAEKVLNKKDAKTRLKLFGKRFFRGFGPVEACIALAILGVILAVALPYISHYYRNQAMESVFVPRPEQKLIYKEKHWANVLILIHSRDTNRVAEIIKEADKPYKLYVAESYGKEYENRVYLVTRELEELIRSKGVRYQQKAYSDESFLGEVSKNMLGFARIDVESSLWINW